MADPQCSQHSPGCIRRASARGTAAPPSDARVVLDDVAIRRALVRIAHEVVERNETLRDLYLVAIPNGGVPLARSIAAQVQRDHRPRRAGRDPRHHALPRRPRRARRAPAAAQTEMPSAVDDRVVVLVDDVVSTGRTIRAAMDALMDFGRPRSVQVVGLVDRGHRELPIKIDFVGKNVPTQRDERVAAARPRGRPRRPARSRDPRQRRG